VKDFLKSRDAGSGDFNVLVLDPPRAGLHPKALKRVLTLEPEKMLYVSCNPATFARDAKTLVDAGYRLPRVQPVDMFPQTMHIELAGTFHRT
jgi:23S rRNA (uracil1939-C5)-methyltransferase